MKWWRCFIVAIVLGIVTTMAVAWACAAFIEPERAAPAFELRQIGEHNWQNIFTFRRFGHERIKVLGGPIQIGLEGSITVGRQDAHVLPGGRVTLSGIDDGQIERTRAGWPLLALECFAKDRFSLDAPAISFRLPPGTPLDLEGGIPLNPGAGWGPTTWRGLPYKPVWPGLIGNIVIFSTLWFALLFGGALTRRVVRRRRGRCVECGYDLRGDLPRGCPECGWERESEIADAVP